MTITEQSNPSLTEHDKFAVELLTWANTKNISNDSYLTAVARDISDERNYSFWANQNALDLLPTVNSSAGMKVMKLSRFLAVIRNVLIFLPVALTWAAVANATAAFAEFIELNGTTTVNFLEFWQNGYGLLDQFWTIGSVAEKVFLTILVVIFVTLISTSLFSQGSKANDAANEEFDRERIKVAIKLNKFFYDRKLATPEGVNREVLKSIEVLNLVSKNLQKTSESTEKIFNSFEKLAIKADRSRDEFSKLPTLAQKQLEDILSEFTSQMQNSSKYLNEATSQFLELFEKLSDFIKIDLSQSFLESKSQIDVATAIITESKNAVKNNSESLESEILSLHSRLREIVSKLK